MPLSRFADRDQYRSNAAPTSRPASSVFCKLLALEAEASHGRCRPHVSFAVSPRRDRYSSPPVSTEKSTLVPRPGHSATYYSDGAAYCNTEGFICRTSR